MRSGGEGLPAPRRGAAAPLLFSRCAALWELARAAEEAGGGGAAGFPQRGDHGSIAGVRPKFSVETATVLFLHSGPRRRRRSRREEAMNASFKGAAQHYLLPRREVTHSQVRRGVRARGVRCRPPTAATPVSPQLPIIIFDPEQTPPPARPSPQPSRRGLLRAPLQAVCGLYRKCLKTLGVRPSALRPPRRSAAHPSALHLPSCPHPANPTAITRYTPSILVMVRGPRRV